MCSLSYRFLHIMKLPDEPLPKSPPDKVVLLKGETRIPENIHEGISLILISATCLYVECIYNSFMFVYVGLVDIMALLKLFLVYDVSVSQCTSVTSLLSSF